MVVVVVAVYAAFGPGLPFTSNYDIRGVFQTANDLQPGSDVRISGINVGSVDGVTPGPQNTAVVTMSITNRTVPIRSDARLTIEPRLALEGNYYVNVDAGSPDAPVLASGSEIPLSRTSGPVQIYQFLNVFNLPSRDALASTSAQLAHGLGYPPGGSATASTPGYAALRRATAQLDGALQPFTEVAAAAQGTQAGDLAHALNSTGDFTSQLVDDPAALSDVVSSFNGTFAALAANVTALSASIRQIDGVLRIAPADLTSIDAALPRLTHLSVALRPTLTAAPEALTETHGFITQVGRLVQPPELPRLLTRLKPVTANLPTLEARLTPLFPYVTLAMGCVSRNVVPTLDKTIQDGPLTNGQPIWQEFLHLGASLSSVASDFDANGTTVRIGINEGEQALRAVIPNLGPIETNGDIEGLSPTWLGNGVYPADRPDQWCVKQPLPILDTRYGVPPAGFKTVSNATNTGQQRGLATLRAAILTRSPGNVLNALDTLMKELGWPASVLEAQLRALRQPARPAQAESPTPATPVSVPHGAPAAGSSTAGRPTAPTPAASAPPLVPPKPAAGAGLSGVLSSTSTAVTSLGSHLGKLLQTLKGL
jgi:ABC-type transporter Mla subunit MlaD